MNQNNDKQNEIKQNIQKSKLFASGFSILAAVFIFIAYLLVKNIWFLVLSGILIISGIAFWVIISRFESRYLNKDEGI